MCVYICVYDHMSAGDCTGQKRKSDPVELELQAGLGSFGRAVCVPNC